VEVVLTAADGDTIAEGLVRDTKIMFHASGADTRVHVPDERVTHVNRGGGGTVVSVGNKYNIGSVGTFISGDSYGNVFSSGDMHISQSVDHVGPGQSIVGAVVGGSVVQVNGRTFIDGREVTGGTQQGSTRGVDTKVYLPDGSALRVKTSTAQTRVRPGPFGLGEVTFASQSADVTVPKAMTLDVTTQSGDVEAGAVGDVSARTQSGDIDVDWANGVIAQTQSGDVTVQGVTGTVQANTQSGDVRVHVLAEGVAVKRVTASTMTGDVRVRGEATGHVSTMTGDITCPPGVTTSTMTGRVNSGGGW
jgi:hypothetical protein